jgi:hypothetical protein
MIASYYKVTGSLTVGTGSKTLTLPAGKTLTTNAIKLYPQGSESTIYMLGAITAYNVATGETTVNVTSVLGSGTSTNYRARIEVAPGTRQTDASDQTIIDYLYKLFGGEPSTTSNTIGTGSKTFTVPVGRLYTTENYLKIASDANNANFMFGNITAYDNATGALTLNVTAVGGSGTFTDWTATIASAAGYTIASHPALGNIEISNERMNSVSAAPSLAEYARVCRIAYTIIKKYKPTCTVTGDTSDQGRLNMTAHMIASAVGGIAVEADLGTGKQACDYLDGVGFNNYYFSNGTFALHQACVEANQYPYLVESGSASVVKAGLQALTKYNKTSRWLGKDPKTIKVMIGEHSMVGAATDIANAGMQAAYWTNGASTEEQAFWDLFRTYIPALLSTQDGLGDYGVAHIFAQDCSVASSTVGTLSAIGAHTTGEVKFLLSVSPELAFSGNLPEKRIVITAPAGGWADLGLSAGQKKRFAVRQVSGNTVYVVGSTYTTSLADGVAYTQYHTDWAPYPEDIARFYNTFANVPLTIGTINDNSITDKIVSPATKRKYPGMFVIVPDVGTNSQYAGTYYINGTNVGSKW